MKHNEVPSESALDFAIYRTDIEGLVTSASVGAFKPEEHTPSSMVSEDTQMGPCSGALNSEGYLASEMVGRHFSIFFPRPKSEIDAADADTIDGSKTGREDYESWSVCKNGSRVRSKVVIEPIFDDNRFQLGSVCVVEDQTARDSQHALEQSEQTLRLFIDSVTHCALYSLDPDGIVRSWNPGAERVTGFARHEIVGSHFSSFFTEEDVERGASAEMLAVARSIGRFEGEGWRIRKDGTRFWASVVIECMYGPNNTLVGFSKVVRDISEKLALEAARDELLEMQRNERQIAETRLRELEDELVRADRLTVIGEIASTLAHEINQPLTTIVNYLRGGRRLIERDGVVDLPLVRHALDQACEQALRAGEIIRHVRQFVTQGVVEKRPESLSHVISQAYELVSTGQTLPAIAASFNFDAGVDVVMIDRVQVQQVLLNLIRNAVEAMAGSSSGTLTISTVLEQDPRFVRIIVADTGCGLDTAVSGRLFQTFVTTKSGGMGMGLSICRTIVEAHGGKIWAQAAPSGHGAEFQFTLPLVEILHHSDVVH